nr:MAG: hypothetical protein [Caudoviricetes sp.]
MKINIGAGYKKIPGYVTVDGDENCNPDVLINLDDKKLILPFEDNTVEEIVAHHILEHIGEGYIRLLQELYRVCKDGAIIDVKVPHPTHEVYLNDPTHKRPITVEGFRLFSKKFNKLEIERGGSSSTLGIMYDVDYELVGYNYIYDSFYDNILPTLSREMVVRLMREALNVAIETEIKLQVIK